MFTLAKIQEAETEHSVIRTGAPRFARLGASTRTGAAGAAIRCRRQSSRCPLRTWLKSS